MDLIIDEEFAGKIPPLTREEYEQLEANILADGVVINPLIVWNGVIVDGHNRYRILQAHPEIPFQVHEKEFSDRYEVIAWICKNQLGRRNLTEAQKKYLIGKQYEAEKMRESFRGNQYLGAESTDESGSGQNDPDHISVRTSERIAREIGKGERYVRRAEEFARGVDAAEELVPGIKQEIFTGVIHPPDKEIVAVARAPSDERKALVEQLRHPDMSHKNTSQPEQDVIEDEDESEDDFESFKPSSASIRAISEGMDSTPDRGSANVDTEFIILELENALSSMMFRWETCISDYRKEAMAKDCQKKIKELVLEGIRYLQQYKGGVRNEAV